MRTHWRRWRIVNFDSYIAVPNPTGVLVAFRKIRSCDRIWWPQVRELLAIEPGDVSLHGFIQYLRGHMLDKAINEHG